MTIYQMTDLESSKMSMTWETEIRQRNHSILQEATDLGPSTGTCNAWLDPGLGVENGTAT